MASELRIADDLALPIDAVTETFLIFGKRGSGKTSTSVVLTEEENFHTDLYAAAGLVIAHGPRLIKATSIQMKNAVLTALDPMPSR